MRESSCQYDDMLSKISHYQQFLIMMPFVGEHYSASPSKTLLIAESFYLPNDCDAHKDAAKWYSSDESVLTDEQKKWANCRGLIEGEWIARSGHKIYIELNSSINEARGIGFEGVAFMNAFQRPSCEEGETMRHFCEELDITNSVAVINEVQKILAPDQIIFVAKYAWDVLGTQIASKNIAKKYDFVCHPGTGGFYWLKDGYPHGKPKFMQLMALA